MRAVSRPGRDQYDRLGRPYLADTVDDEDVIELPTGLRDGFGEIGRFDHRALVHQMYHGRPLVGGFVGRLSPRIRAFYERSMSWKSMIALSTGTSPLSMGGTEIADANDWFASVSFVVLNRDAVPNPDMVGYVIEHMGFHRTVDEGDRVLYERRQ